MSNNIGLKIRLATYGAIAASLIYWMYERGAFHYVYERVSNKIESSKTSRTVADVVGIYGESARSRLKPYFEEAGVSYPPQKVAFLAMKDTKLMEVWAFSGDKWTKIRDYDILGTSGKLGPKKEEGDLQVPEGLYKIEGLNPNSSFHLSMKVNYPNDFDLKWAKVEGRTQPGSNIFIHGKTASIGCLAMGDEVIEELFILGADSGRTNIDVLIAPTDPRVGKLMPPEGSKEWVSELYRDIEMGFDPFK